MGCGWGMGYGILFFILMIIGVIYLIKYLVNSRGKENNSAHPSDHSLEILKERYARGEIDDKEFNQKKKVLFDR